MGRLYKRKGNLDRITVTKILKCFQTNWCRKRRKTFKIEKFVVLAEYFEQQTDCNRYRRKISKSRSPLWRVVFAFRYQTNGYHATKLSTAGHVIIRAALKRYFRFAWNCKQLRADARSSIPDCEIYFPLFSETIHTTLEIFLQHHLRKYR